MRVRIAFTLDVDPEAWANEYGIASEDVREDVRAHIEAGAREQLQTLGLLARE